MKCPRCGGTMSPNENKTTEKSPDWRCNQDNGDCGKNLNGKFFPTGVWNKKNTGEGDRKFNNSLESMKQKESADATGQRMNRSNLAGRLLTGYLAKHDIIPWGILQQLEKWVDTGNPPKPLTDEQEEEIAS